MTLPMIAILAGFGILTVWGVVSPRGQWRALAGWSRRHPYASEPGPVSVGIHRAVAIVATAALVFGAVQLMHQPEKPVRSGGTPVATPTPTDRTSPTQLRWGAPDPAVVDRYIPEVSTVPSGLVSQPVLRYEAVDGVRRKPGYLFTLKDWAPKDARGLVGNEPSPGLAALDTASLVVQVRADPRCIPRGVVVVENALTVAVGVYFGRPDPAKDEKAVPLTDCATVLADQKSVSMLIPIQLGNALLGRAVLGLDGKAIPAASAG